MSIVELVPVRLGVADQVEPVPGPALAVVGRSEQPVDDPLERLRASRRPGTPSISSGVGGRPIRSNVTRREQRPLVGRRRGRKTRGFEPREDKAIDRRARPGSVLDPRRRDIRQWLKAPMPGPLGKIERPNTDGCGGAVSRSRHSFLRARARRWRTHSTSVAISSAGNRDLGGI